MEEYNQKQGYREIPKVNDFKVDHDPETMNKILDGNIIILETIGEGATCKVKHVIAKVEDEENPSKNID